jgi:3-oxoacyl-[acyl-carrier-protein] synthase-3
LTSVFRSDGRQWPLAVIKSGGTMYGWEKPKFHSVSARLLAVAAKELPPVILSASRKLGWNPREVEVIVPHQVSSSFARKMCGLMGVPAERCIITLDTFGNCGAASVPLALSHGVAEGRVKAGDRVALLAAAAGFSAGVVGMIW